jgi:histidinol-phosphate aminotransferase
MSFDPNTLLRKHLINLKSYSSARDEYTGKEGVFLDANENPYGSAGVREAYNRYPDPYQQEVKQAVAKIKNIAAESIFLGNGSDEPSDLLIRAFCEPAKDKVVIVPPTYGMYEVSAGINDVGILRVPLNENFQLDVKGVISATGSDTKILFLCSPNNPTGNLIRKEDLFTLLHQFPNLVVIDEAYIDFAPDAGFLPHLHRFPNLVVLQTLSKAWGLAGVRLGMAFASPEIITILNRIKPPYNIAAPTQRIVREALGKVLAKEKMVADILEQKNWLEDQLAALPIVQHIYPSDANFMLIRVSKPKEIYQFLIDQQVIVRDRSNVMRCHGCLRITVGTREENEALLKAMALVKEDSFVN